MTDRELIATDRTTLRRHAERARPDLGTIHAILDEGKICHLGFAAADRPMAMPTAYARVGDRVYLHGAAGNWALRTLAAGAEVCLTVTLLDGLVLARSAFHHSINYRSVMLFGTATAITDEHEKAAALDAIVEHLVPGRSTDARAPTAQELRQTLVLALVIDEGSAKVRSGPPIDDDADLGLPVWAGVVPITVHAGPPIPDPLMADSVPIPDYITCLGG